MKRADSQQSIDAITQAGLKSAQVFLDALTQFVEVANANNPLLALQNRSCCDIPPACWLPRCFGAVTSQACPCGTALLRIRVSNCQPTDSEIRVRVNTDADLDIKVTPERSTLGPMQCKWFTLAVSIPDDACKGQSYELVAWVAGCNEHYARWTVTVADGASGTCTELHVEDCPDYEHHWYDHFYCNRPCFSPAHKRDS